MVRRSSRRDGGFAVVLMSLIMVTLLGAVTVAVDLGSRYAEAAKIQRAADAAALAGVTVLPKGLSIAETEARQVAARNGYTHGVDGVTVDVDQVDAEIVQVRIEDPSVPQYFASLFDGGTSIARVATAKYVRAVALGSPRNFLGTGNLLGADNGGDMRYLSGRSQDETEALRENYWLAISGECSSKENGDRFNTWTDANYANTQNPRRLDDPGNWAACTGGNTDPNLEFRDYGYVYAVTVPPEYQDGENLAIEVFDPAICENSRPGDPGNAESYGMDTTFTVRTGSADPLGGEVIHEETFRPEDHGCSNWTTLHTVTPPDEGATYYIQVDAGKNHQDSGTMSNGFALRANVTAKNPWYGFWGCSSDPVETDLYDAACPQVYSVGDMGVFASLTGSQAEFFLAEIGPEYNGKTLEITLFDPGEGAEALRIKDPEGDYVSFDWKVDCDGTTPPTDGCSGTDDDVLDLIGETSNYCPRGDDVDTDGNGYADRCVNNPQPGPRRLSRWKYSARSITLSVDLPDDIADEYDDATWWKVEYTTNTAPTDRTTWSVQVLGDPVRLIPNPDRPRVLDRGDP